MEYKLIVPQHVFRYRALPREQWGRITALPPGINLELPPLSGFSQVDAQAEQQVRQSINWEEVPERNLSGCQFMDTFAALVHEYGFNRMDFYAKKMHQVSKQLTHFNAEDLSRTIRVLSGIPAPEWVIGYTLMMINDLECRTNLKRIEIAAILHFTTPQSFSQFMRNYGAGI